MNKKRLLMLASVLALAACDRSGEVSEIEVEETIVDDEETTGNDTETPEVDDPEDDTTDDNTTDDNTNSGAGLGGAQGDDEDTDTDPDPSAGQNETGTHLFDNLVNLETFVNEHGYRAWEDYQTIGDQVIISDVTDLENLNGSSRTEVENVFANIADRDGIVIDAVDVTEDEQMVIFRYPADDASEYSELAEYYSELTFYYIQDNLVFTSITPGFYSVDITGLPSADELSQYTSVSQIEDLGSQVYTVSEMVVQGEPMYQTMVPAMANDEEGNEVISAFYFFTREDEIIQYAYLPFDQPSVDFPTYSLSIYQQYVATLGSN